MAMIRTTAEILSCIWDEAPKFKVSNDIWDMARNDTGYYNDYQLVLNVAAKQFAPEVRPQQLELIAATTDPKGRKCIVLSTITGTTMLFERYTGGEGGVWVHNGSGITESLLGCTKITPIGAMWVEALWQMRDAPYLPGKGSRTLANLVKADICAMERAGDIYRSDLAFRIINMVCCAIRYGAMSDRIRYTIAHVGSYEQHEREDYVAHKLHEHDCHSKAVRLFNSVGLDFDKIVPVYC